MLHAYYQDHCGRKTVIRNIKTISYWGKTNGKPTFLTVEANEENFADFLKSGQWDETLYISDKNNAGFAFLPFYIYGDVKATQIRTESGKKLYSIWEDSKFCQEIEEREILEAINE